eukprot:5074704-Amphidinium_carterae.1
MEYHAEVIWGKNTSLPRASGASTSFQTPYHYEILSLCGDVNLCVRRWASAVIGKPDQIVEPIRKIAFDMGFVYGITVADVVSLLRKLYIRSHHETVLEKP